MKSRQRIVLSEESGVRYLHFGSEWVQGAMRIARPDTLELEYQQQMMAPLLFLPRPRRILQLGLGAAALTKFCRRHLPGARIAAVELDPDVVAAARRWFELPDDDLRLQVIVDDALAYLERSGEARFDWLQADLYDGAARGPVHDHLPFYALCRRALTAPGVAAFNLFGRRFGPSFERIHAAFDGRAVALPAAAEGNRIVLAFHGPRIEFPWPVLRAQAQRIRQELGLPAARWLTGLHEQSRQHGSFEL